MKSALKAVLKKILFNVNNPTAFPAVQIATGTMKERFLLKMGEVIEDVSDRHSIVCHNPFCIAVWMPKGHQVQKECEALVTSDDRHDARLGLSVLHRIPEGENELIVFEATNAENFQLSKLRQALIRRYFKNKNSVLEDKFYAAAYSFPRRVIAVSFKDGDYYNIFPMDFQCFLKERNMYVLGLRTTNVTLNRIIEKKRVVIGDTDQAEVKILYALGNHHSSAPPSLDKLPFSVIESEQFGFPVPSFCAEYKEIELISNFKIGTHMMLIGKVVNEKALRLWTSSVYHTHFFHASLATYPPANSIN